MPAVFSFLGRVGLSLLKRTGSFLLKKTPSYLASGVRSLSNNFQRKREEEENGNARLQVLQALGLIKKPSFLEKLHSDQSLLITLVCLTGLVFLLLILPLLIIFLPATSLVSLKP